MPWRPARTGDELAGVIAASWSKRHDASAAGCAPDTGSARDCTEKPAMSTLRAVLTVSALSLTLGVTAIADTKMTLKQLPAPVRKAAEENLKGGVITGVSKEIEKGKTLYEVETTVAGHGRDLLFDADGTLVSVEEAVALDAVPEAVRKALTSRGHVVKVETVTSGASVTYEGVVEKAGKRTEVALSADGTPVHP